MAALVTGSLRNHQGDGTSGVSNAFYYSQGYLTVQAEDWMEQVGGDIEKIDEILGRKAIAKNFSLSFGDDPAHVMIILADTKGSCRWFASDKDTMKIFDWGYSSDSLGWGETPEIKEPKIEEPAKPAARELSFSKKTDTKNKIVSTSSFSPTPSGKPQELEAVKPPKGATHETNPEWFFQVNP